MSSDEQFLSQLLDAWELTFKKGQLSFWVLISLKEGPKYLDEILSFIQVHSSNRLSYDEQSVYRSLRKFTDLELVEFEHHESKKGPDLKHFKITELGKMLLQKFIERNISIFYQPNLIQIINQQ